MTELLHSPDTHRLGKKDAKPPRAMLRDFVDIERVAQTLPANIINSNNQSIPLAMYLNNNEGCCTCSGVGNSLRVDSNGTKQITDGDVQTGYVAVTGREGAAYDPTSGANDNGCAEIDVLDYWVQVGVGGDKLVTHAGVDFNNILEVRTALHMCGPLYPGWQLSTDQQSQQVWAPGSAAPGSWGGHCAPVSDYYTQPPATISGTPIPAGQGDIFTVLTWAQYKPCVGAYIPFACDELHALITDAWIARNQGNPAVNMQALSYIKTLQPES
jgi:hypothetical protein